MTQIKKHLSSCIMALACGIAIVVFAVWIGFVALKLAVQMAWDWASA